MHGPVERSPCTLAEEVQQTTVEKREPHAGATAMTTRQGFVPGELVPEDVVAILAALEKLARPPVAP